LDAAESWLSDLSTGPARRRVLQLLVRLHDHADTSGKIWLPRREEIGAMLDMTEETASRIVSALRREGVIAAGRFHSAHLDMDLLQLALRAEDAG
ncbi:MAG: Crp/Fnr family transcriptional regulator, partial [Burkholderiales bacterium]|nr:Crp/Fnr family transcriptional regulator [Burkholderiales bacterium]